MNYKLAMSTVALVLVSLLPSVSGTSGVFSDTFEDEVVGGAPIGSYTFSHISGTGTALVSSDQHHTGSNSLNFSSSTGTNEWYFQTTTTFCTASPGISFWVYLPTLPTADLLFFPAGGTAWPQSLRILSGGEIVLNDGFTVPGNTHFGTISAATWTQFNITVSNCSPGPASFSVTSSTLGTTVTLNNQHLAITSSLHVYFDLQMTGAARFYIDDVGTESAPVISPPSEFDSGLITFIVGLGFITPQSQFFFSLIVIGLTTVILGVSLKFMSPGKLKLILVFGTAALVGAFFAILQLFDLWMFVTAFVLGGVIVKGASEFRNTFSEIRGFITAARSKRAVGEGSDGDAEQAMASESGKVTVEEVDEPGFELPDSTPEPEPSSTDGI